MDGRIGATPPVSPGTKCQILTTRPTRQQMLADIAALAPIEIKRVAG
jgi:hypothetical protein